MDTQGSGYVDPADQWVLDPETGTYQLRLEPPEPPSPAVPGTGPQPAPSAVVPAPSPEAPAAGDRRIPSERAPSDRTSGRTSGRIPSDRTSGRAASGRGGRRAAGHGSATGTGTRSGSRGAPSRRKPKPRRSRALLWTAGAIGLAVVAGGLGGYFAFHRSGTVIHAVDVGNAGTSASTASGALNVLVLGTDSRAGLGHEYGAPAATGRADTALLLHLSADRGDATAVSIPPNLVTDIPECPVGDKVVKGASGQPFADVLAGRDPGCAMRLVTQLTGVRVDHFLEVDFAAVRELTTALGGVGLCVNKPLHDAASGLSLGAGSQKVMGDQALALVRAEQALPGADDLARVALQQRFLADLFRTATSGATLTNPKKLAALADTAAGVLTVDTPISSVSALRNLAEGFGKVPAEHFTFAQLPVKTNTADSGRRTVVIDAAKSTQLFGLVKRDVSLSLGPVKTDPKLVGPKTTPHDTRVTVHNGTGTFGASQDVLQWLQNDEGVNRSANAGDASKHYAKTVLRYAPNQADQARELAAMMGLPASALVEGTKDVPPLTYMDLYLGADYTKPGVPIAAPTTPPKGLKSITAAATACVG